MGATCKYCGKDMTSDEGRKGCKWPFVEINGQIYARDVVYYDTGIHCHDCGIINKPGTLHHPGCDIERCPICGGQAICCECDYDKVSFLMERKPGRAGA